MKKIIICTVITLISCCAAKAQDYSMQDSIVFRPADVLDKSLEGRSVFGVVCDENVTIHQSSDIVRGMNEHIQSNHTKTMTGYRVRIFFENKQDSRSASENAMKKFQGAFPGIPAYRSFKSPFFKVTVGDFRTKSEAVQLLQTVKGMFPSAFIIKEKISYPAVDRTGSYVVDTIQVLKPVVEII